MRSQILIKITANDGWFEIGEIFWIEWDGLAWRSATETKNRLAGTSVQYTKYKKLNKTLYPEYFL